MRMDNQKRKTVKETLLKNMSVLRNMLSDISEMKRRAIQLDIESFELGWIHIGIAGQTSCGKSTVINALSRDIVVPENPMIATPIPTYIAKSSADADMLRVTVFHEDEENKNKELTRREFLTEFCYNAKDMTGNNPERLRFKEYRYAVAHTKGELFDKGAVLLDTLGTGATELDDIKTSTILKGNVDFLIYIVGTNMLTLNDIAFLQCYILGYTPKESAVKRMNYSVGKPIVTPDKLIIFGNDKNGIFRSGLVQSVKRIFKSDDCTLSDAQITEFCDNNVWIANALYGRLDGAGFYDYVNNAPLGSDKIYLDEAETLNENHRSYLERIKNKGNDIFKIQQWNTFCEYIGSLCDKCFDDGSDFIKDKCDSVINNFREAKQIFEDAKNKIRENLGNFQARIDELVRIAKGISDTIKRIPEDRSIMAERMVCCVQSCLDENRDIILDVTFSELVKEEDGEMNTPPTDLPTYQSVIEMTDAERLNALDPFIKPIVADVLSKSGYKVSNYLWSLSGSASVEITDDVPIKHYKKIIKYLEGHIHNLIGLISQMKDAGIAIVGIVLPSETELEMIRNDLEERILKAIESSFDSMADTKNWSGVFSANIGKILRLGFFGTISAWFNGGVSKEDFWDKIRDQLIPKIINKMGSDAMQNIESAIRPSVNIAYSYVEHSIRDIYVQCRNDCRAAIKKMQELNDVGASEDLIRSLEEKIEKCNKAIVEIERVLQS